MNTYGSRPCTSGPRVLWRRFQIWRAMRKYARIIELRTEAEVLKIEADMLMRENAQPPMPLFDRDEAQRARDADRQ